MRRRTSFWQLAALVVLAAAVVIGLLSYKLGMRLPEAAASIGSLLTVVALLLAFNTLRETHEWNRRHYTIELMGSWNTRARPHLSFLEHEFPNFFAVPDFIGNPEVLRSWKLDADRARQLVASDGSPPQAGSKDLEIRDHLIELFNYFEDLSIAYEQYIVDRSTAEDSFAPTMIDVYTFFQPFIEEMRRVNRRDPWPPISRTVDLWYLAATRRKAQEVASEVEKRHREATEKAEKSWGRPTGI
jgi:hypothetical protein